jgi:hypothetical protein
VLIQWSPKAFRQITQTVLVHIDIKRFSHNYVSNNTTFGQGQMGVTASLMQKAGGLIMNTVRSGGRCGQWTGCVSSHVHTNRLLLWDTLRGFAAILTL